MPTPAIARWVLLLFCGWNMAGCTAENLRDKRNAFSRGFTTHQLGLPFGGSQDHSHEDYSRHRTDLLIDPIARPRLGLPDIAKLGYGFPRTETTLWGGSAKNRSPSIPIGFKIGRCTVSATRGSGLTVSSLESDSLFNQITAMYGKGSCTYVEVMSATEFIIVMRAQFLRRINNSRKLIFIKTLRGISMQITKTVVMNEFPAFVGSNPCSCNDNTQTSRGSFGRRARDRTSDEANNSKPTVPSGFRIGRCTVIVSRSSRLTITSLEGDSIFNQIIAMYGKNSCNYAEVISASEFIVVMKSQFLRRISNSAKSIFIKTLRGTSVQITKTVVLNGFPAAVGSNPCKCNGNIQIASGSFGSGGETSGEASDSNYCDEFFAENNVEALPPLPCPDGWNSIPPYCYLDTTIDTDYYSAKDLCTSKFPGQSHLVFFKSSQEYDDFKNANLGYETYWLGLTDLIRETDFIWDDGSSLANFGLPYGQYPWYSTEPDNRTSATNWDYINCDCVRSDKKYSFAWRDDHCTNPKWNTVCQMEDGSYPQKSSGTTPEIPEECRTAKKEPTVPGGFGIGMCTIDPSRTAGLTVSGQEADTIFTQIISKYGSGTCTYVEVLSRTEFIIVIKMTVLRQLLRSRSNMIIQTSNHFPVTIVKTVRITRFSDNVGSNPCTCSTDSSTEEWNENGGSNNGNSHGWKNGHGENENSDGGNGHGENENDDFGGKIGEGSTRGKSKGRKRENDSTGGKSKGGKSGEGSTGGNAKGRKRGKGNTGVKTEGDESGEGSTGGKWKGDKSGDGSTGGKSEGDKSGEGSTGGKSKDDKSGEDSTGGKWKDDKSGDGSTGGKSKGDKSGEGSTGGKSKYDKSGEDSTGGKWKEDKSGDGSTGGKSKGDKSGEDSTRGKGNGKGKGKGH